VKSKKVRILFIAPRVFGYEQEIKREMEVAGCEVDLFDDRPSTSSLAKAIIRLRPELIEPWSRAHIRGIVDVTARTVYDIVFVLKGEAISYANLCMLRRAHPTACFVYYTWDSLKNVRNGARKLDHFDRAYSFDHSDCAVHSRISHLPLFYTPPYEQVGILGRTSNTDKNIDLLFIGTIHSDRFTVVERIKKAAFRTDPQLRVVTRWYYSSKWVFALRKVFDRGLRPVPWGLVSWTPLSASDIAELISKTRILVDIHHPGQSGLTMRTIESVGARTKLITTNPDVVKYDFYSTQNVLVVDRADPVVPASFLATPYEPPREDVYSRLSLRSWVREILGNAVL